MIFWLKAFHPQDNGPFNEFPCFFGLSVKPPGEHYNLFALFLFNKIYWTIHKAHNFCQ
jgi:hypothetical protein